MLKFGIDDVDLRKLCIVYLRCKSIRIGIYCGIIINFYVIGYEWVKYRNNNYLLKYKVLIKIRDFNLW